MLEADYQNWENSLSEDSEQDKAALVIMGAGQLDQWTGGVDFTDQVAYLPERVEWDKRAGGWKCESFTGSKLIDCRLVAVTTLWAIWSERVGSPEDLQVGVRPEGKGYEMGLRVIFELDDFLYYWDTFGITFKSAQSAVRRAQKSGGRFSFVDQREINTRFGPFFIPVLEKIDEGK